MAEGLRNDAQAIRRGDAQLTNNGFFERVQFSVFRARNLNFIKARQAGFQTAQSFLHRFGKGAADGHDLADRLHRCREDRLAAWVFFKGKARNLGDDIIDAWLKGGRSHLGDVVLQFIKRIADGQLGGDLGDWEAGGLGCKRGAARHARVHFDDDHATVLRIERELDV